MGANPLHVSDDLDLLGSKCSNPELPIESPEYVIGSCKSADNRFAYSIINIDLNYAIHSGIGFNGENRTRLGGMDHSVQNHADGNIIKIK